VKTEESKCLPLLLPLWYQGAPNVAVAYEGKSVSYMMRGESFDAHLCEHIGLVIDKQLGFSDDLAKPGVRLSRCFLADIHGQ